ncbi:MAG: hypothetical protein HUU22_05230 [Phycisphaerae bacterium]|nr:hypothetical protein [Phycisphaerae bacterium]NUQ45416.1 hypothetical protein [Phycisphaerae bacterium]
MFLLNVPRSRCALLAAVSAVGLLAAGAAYAIGNKHTSTTFKGAKVNAGFVTHEHKDGRHTLTWSDDFKIPDTPAPHWQVVDTKGNVYLLNRLKIKDDKENRTITLPTYVKDIAKVQIWCAYAEALLGEARFEPPVK